MAMRYAHGVNCLGRNFRSHSLQMASKELEDVHVARYTVRVELHKANSDDYDNLHGFMEQEDFIRYIVNGNDGLKYRLPTAEYNISSTGGRALCLRGPSRPLHYREEVYGACDRIEWTYLVESAGLERLVHLIQIDCRGNGKIAKGRSQ